ncbi:cystathionine gamma-synthase [Actinopolymorpha cephalotaxi]|uniref:homocysteine desulfhydrase n=1 Tax=Actinopolymorpha cephalotaxi TaxID=504797 RepID=A0A1I3AJH2_9ACTN|nr:PLP-dependent transferase [Actinopolymorpha cephalotaxi]NYH82189.1 cystathionine gamma-synthase [Actinopolymorpha cephalotaxi]SFH50185.1 cystathionine gamma-synthase [Actinopolymorpha cephalotaxi]
MSDFEEHAAPEQPPAQSQSTPMAQSPEQSPSHSPGAPALGLDTVAVTAGRPPHDPDQPLNPPLVLASTYVAGGDLEYGRYANPTWTAFEEVLGALEGGRALAFPSGLAAVATILDLVPVGGVVVAPRHAYLGTVGQLADLVESGRLSAAPLVDIADTEGTLALLPGADLVILESPTNPALEVADLPALCAGAREAGAAVVVDNTFATPMLQRPLEYGADVVLHSATKYLAGHSDLVLGALVTAPTERGNELHDLLDSRRRKLGATPGAFETWLALRGLRTLPLRVERACANAAVLAHRLAQHPAVDRVRYPGLRDDPGHARATAQMSAYGAVVAVEVRGGAEAAEALTTATRLWVRATSLGGVESTLERRRRWPGESATIPDNLVRLSVGVEDVEDLWADLSAALSAVGGDAGADADAG